MATKRSRWWIVLLLTGAAAAGWIVAKATVPPPEPPPVLPDSTAEQEVVDQSHLLTEISAKQKIIDQLGLRVDEVAGKLRTAENENANLRTLIEIDTGPVAPPDTVVITETIREACEEPEAIDPMGRIRTDLVQFAGLNEHGEERYGWAGYVTSDISLDGGRNWSVLAETPLDLKNIRAAGTETPDFGRGKRWYVGLQWSALTGEDSFYDYSLDQTVLLRPDRWRAYGGRTWFDRKRFSVGTGVFVDADAIGLDLRVNF